ncbi:MAG: pyrroloquinoline quinone biosynthesis protein PqqB [Dehalococcoidia bacterium]|nr:pyrroloquinoline quinone biosynthesis protein PqqB [Dehalococcoidia bacterium]
MVPPRSSRVSSEAAQWPPAPSRGPVSRCRARFLLRSEQTGPSPSFPASVSSAPAGRSIVAVRWVQSQLSWPPVWSISGQAAWPTGGSGIHDAKTDRLLLIEATPAIESQLSFLHELSGSTRPSRVPVDGILLTHAHIGHYTGLMQLGREVASTKKMPVWVTPRMAEFLRHNGPWSQLVQLEQIKLLEVSPGSSFSPLEGLEIEAITVPHRDEFSDTVAFRIHGPHRTVLFVPDVDRWSGHDGLLESLLEGVDIAYIDATFYDGRELPGRDLSEIPHPPMVDTMRRLADQAKQHPGSFRFIHLNHTNPAMRDTALQRSIKDAGFAVAVPGERVGL